MSTSVRELRPDDFKGYPEWVSHAVARGRALTEERAPELVAHGKHVGHAGPIQHAKVRFVIKRDLLDDSEPTAEELLELLGVSYEDLKKIATWKAPRSALMPMRRISALFRPDSWAQGRYLAAIMCAWVEECVARQADRRRTLDRRVSSMNYTGKERRKQPDRRKVRLMG